MGIDNSRADISAFQMEAVHEDISAGFFAVCDQLGIKVNGHYNRRILESRGDFFDWFNYNTVHIDYGMLNGRECWNVLRSRVESERSKVLYFNTFQREGLATWAKDFDLPIIGIVHNPNLFKESPTCCALAREGRFTALCLSDHVKVAIEDRVPELRGRTHVYYPYYWLPEGADRYQVPGDTLDIVIPGAVNFSNRDFSGLLDFLSTQDLSKVRSFKFSILAGGPDHSRLEQEIRERNIAQFFDLAPLDEETKRVPHNVYQQRLARCDAIMLLLPSGRRDYVTTKISTGVAAAFGTGRPVIAPQGVAEVYGFHPLLVPNERPYDIMHTDLSDTALSAARKQMLQRRDQCLSHNAKTLEKILFTRLAEAPV